MAPEADFFGLPPDVRASLAERICVSCNSSAVIALLGWLEVPASPSLVETAQRAVVEAFNAAQAGSSRGDLLLDTVFQVLREKGLKPGWDLRHRCLGTKAMPRSRFDRDPLV